MSLSLPLKSFIICFLLTVGGAAEVWSQVKSLDDEPLSEESDTTAPKPIVVINADKTKGFDKGIKSVLTGNVKLRQDSTVISAHKVNLNSETNSAEAFGEVIIQRRDTTNAFCEELLYDGNKEYAIMSGEVVLQNGRQQLFSQRLDYDMRTNVAHYSQRALLTDGTRLISSKKGRYYLDSSLVVFYDSVVVAGPEYSMKTDSLHFNTVTNTAYFVAPVRMKQRENLIYCEAGYYNLNKNFAELRQNAQFSSPTQEATADTILFDGKTEDISLIGNAWVKEVDREATADRIDYQKSRDKALLIGNVDYRDKDQTATGERIEYTLSTGAFRTEGRAEVRQGSQYLAAENMREILNSETVHATGNVIWYDTIQQVSLYCTDAYINKANKSVKAFGEDLLLISQLEGDSLFITADTLETVTVTLEDSSEAHQLFAYYHVVGYKKDLQFISDSISFNESDSLFQIFGNPVIWSDTSRFFGDTIYIQLANDAIDELFIKNNAFIINKNNTEFFNQVKGREIVAQFVDGELNQSHVRGNAESIYYAIDERNAYLGVNKIACSEMQMYFANNQVSTIRFYRKPTSTFYPMRDVDHQKIRLEGFSFDQSMQSKSPMDIYRVYKLLQVL